MASASAIAADTVATEGERLHWASWRLPTWVEPAAAVAVTLVGLAPVIAVVIQRAGRPYLPMQDSAIIDLRVRDVLTFSNNTPLVGVYSHYWFNHPGPALFYVVAPFAWLFGNAAWATLVGFALLQGLAIAWTGRLAFKTGGLQWTVVWVAIAVLAYVATGPVVLELPWNPSVAMPFFVLFLLQCWVVAQGSARRLIGLVFVASFLVQAHISYAILVLILGAWAIVRLAVSLRRQRRLPDRYSLLGVAGVFVAMWFAPLLLDPLLNVSSNLDRLAHFYTSPNRPAVLGVSQGLRYLATEFRWPPPWLGGSDPLNLALVPVRSSLGWLILPGVLIALAWWISWRRRRRELRVLAELVALLLVGSALSISLIQGAPQPYLMFWRIVAGVATVVLMFTVVVDALVRGRWLLIRHAWACVLAVTLTIASAVVTERVVGDDRPVWIEPTAASILSQLHRQGVPDGPTLVRPWGTTIGGLAVGLIDQLAREHEPVFVDPWLGFEFGSGRTATPRQVRWVLTVGEQSAVYALGSFLPHARVVAVSHPLPARQQARLVQLERQLAGVLATAGEEGLTLELGDPLVAFELAHVPGISAHQLQELAGLNATVAKHGCLCSVIEYPARSSPIGPQGPPV